MFFLDVCGSLHLSPRTVIYEITNKWAPVLQGRICAFLAWGEGIWQHCCRARGSKSFSRCGGSSQHRRRKREEGREREREIKGDRDLGGRELTPLTVGLLSACSLRILHPKPAPSVPQRSTGVSGGEWTSASAPSNGS